MRKLPHPSTDSFHLSGNGGPALFIHGFTGSTYEVLPIAQYLNERFDLDCYGPKLLGHYDPEQALRNTSALQWFEQLGNILHTLSNKGPVIVVGLSMGGLLASWLAARAPERIKALVLLAPAFYVKASVRLAIGLAKRGFSRVAPELPKLGGSDIGSREARAINPTVHAFSTRALIEFEHVRNEAIEHLSKICCPLFVAFGAKDKTVDPKKSAQILKDRLEIPHDYLMLGRSQHIITLDVDRFELYEAIGHFCEKLNHEPGFPVNQTRCL